MDDCWTKQECLRTLVQWCRKYDIDVNLAGEKIKKVQWKQCYNTGNFNNTNVNEPESKAKKGKRNALEHTKQELEQAVKNA